MERSTLRKAGTTRHNPRAGTSSVETVALLVLVVSGGSAGLASLGKGWHAAIVNNPPTAVAVRAANSDASTRSGSRPTERRAAHLAQPGVARGALALAHHLPTRRTSAYDAFVHTLRDAFLGDGASGYALLDLRPHIPDEFAARARAFLGTEETAEGLGSLSDAAIAHVLGDYNVWLDGLTADGLRMPGPRLRPGVFNDRVSWARRSGGLSWHIDGAQHQAGVGAVTAFVGPGTRVMPEAPDLRSIFRRFHATDRPRGPDERVSVGVTREVPRIVGQVLEHAGFGVDVPEGHVVFLTTADIFGGGTFRGLKPTLHARPRVTGERRLAGIRRYGVPQDDFMHGNAAPMQDGVLRSLTAMSGELVSALGEPVYREVFEQR